MREITCSQHLLLQASNARKMIGERKASPSDAVDIPISRTSPYQPLFPVTTQCNTKQPEKLPQQRILNNSQHKTTGQAPTAKNSTLAVERHRLDGSREKTAKNIEPVLHDQRLFITLWSQKLYKIFYSVIRYLR